MKNNHCKYSYEKFRQKVKPIRKSVWVLLGGGQEIPLLRCPKSVVAPFVASDFDRCAFSPSLYLPPAAFGLKARAVGAKVRIKPY